MPKPPKERREIVTLSDLAPNYDVKGGGQQRVFGDQDRQDDQRTLEENQMKKVKDLPAGKKSGTIKGGRAQK